ncbi:hypothetical protein CVT24_012093 [Panaeolus cyanescens]|uniref:Uncharacterized protein n=1 Tax=Panaeolus cyanescens TaxID=181874 RepID=A0A409X5R3_9AGAR|nr:hypothetical protein CVT24_012093 [Panaeolus cyanescens]
MLSFICAEPLGTRKAEAYRLWTYSIVLSSTFTFTLKSLLATWSNFHFASRHLSSIRLEFLFVTRKTTTISTFQSTFMDDESSQQYYPDDSQWLVVEGCVPGDVVWGYSMNCWYAENGRWEMREDRNPKIHPMIVIDVRQGFCEVLVCSHFLPDDLDEDSRAANCYRWKDKKAFEDWAYRADGELVTVPTCVALGTSFFIDVRHTWRRIKESLPMRLEEEGLWKLRKDIVDFREGRGW